ncbi:MAG: hypothetical protein NTV23_01775 [Propionibacteriales bacterium]|nr:hypothetical protein [Propionibacteriales bacterium]
MRRSGGLALVLVVVLALGLSGCGKDDDYCAVAKADQEVFVDDGTGLSLVSNIETLKQIAAKSPDDLVDEWEVFLDAVEGLRAAIDDVGLKPSDFVGGQAPASTPSADRQRIAAAADRLAQEDVVSAANGIEQHAKDVCKFQLGF